MCCHTEIPNIITEEWSTPFQLNNFLPVIHAEPEMFIFILNLQKLITLPFPTTTVVLFHNQTANYCIVLKLQELLMQAWWGEENTNFERTGINQSRCVGVIFCVYTSMFSVASSAFWFVWWVTMHLNASHMHGMPLGIILISVHSVVWTELFLGMSLWLTWTLAASSQCPSPNEKIKHHLTHEKVKM